MKTLQAILGGCLAITISSTSAQPPSETGGEALPLFRKVAERLLSLKTISYQYVRELDYPAEAIHSTMTGRMYMDFAKENDLSGFRYQFSHASGFAIFNNTAMANTVISNAPAHRLTFEIQNGFADYPGTGFITSRQYHHQL